MTGSRSEVVIFTHLLKCGGSSAWRVLVDAALAQEGRWAVEDVFARAEAGRPPLRGDPDWTNVAGDRWTAHIDAAKAIRSRWRRSHHRDLIVHHHAPVSLREVFPEARHVLLVRDPLDRLLSQYRHDALHAETLGIERPTSLANYAASHPQLLHFYSRCMASLLTGRQLLGDEGDVDALAQLWRGRLLAVPFEEYVRGGPRWRQVCKSLGLPPLASRQFEPTETASRVPLRPADIRTAASLDSRLSSERELLLRLTGITLRAAPLPAPVRRSSTRS